MLESEGLAVSIRMTEEEYADLMKRRCVNTLASPAETKTKPKRQKYGNRRVEIDGMKFDSQHESDVYFGTLLPSWKAGVLRLLVRQVPFDLPGGIKYIADFVTVSADGNIRVIDAKSEITRKNRVYINKKKQMRACWGIEIQEV